MTVADPNHAKLYAERPDLFVECRSCARLITKWHSVLCDDCRKPGQCKQCGQENALGVLRAPDKNICPFVAARCLSCCRVPETKWNPPLKRAAAEHEPELGEYSYSERLATGFRLMKYGVFMPLTRRRS